MFVLNSVLNLIPKLVLNLVLKDVLNLILNLVPNLFQNLALIWVHNLVLGNMKQDIGITAIHRNIRPKRPNEVSDCSGRNWWS